MSATSVAMVADGARVKVLPFAVSLTGWGTTVFGNVLRAVGAADAAVAAEEPAAVKPIAVTRATAARARRAAEDGFRRILFILGRSAQVSGPGGWGRPGAMPRARAARGGGPAGGDAMRAGTAQSRDGS